MLASWDSFYEHLGSGIAAGVAGLLVYSIALAAGGKKPRKDSGPSSADAVESAAAVEPAAEGASQDSDDDRFIRGCFRVGFFLAGVWGIIFLIMWLLEKSD